MGRAFLVVTDDWLKELFTEGIRTRFEIVRGIPDDARLIKVAQEAHDHRAYRFWFEHESFSEGDRVEIETRKYYR